MSFPREEILQIFLQETSDLIEGLENDILAFESNPTKEQVNKVFRSFHTIKGSSNIVGIKKLSELTHIVESYLVKIRDGIIEPFEELTSGILSTVDLLNDMIVRINNKQEVDENRFQELIDYFNNLSTAEKPYLQTPSKPQEKQSIPVIESANLNSGNWGHYYIIQLKFREEVITEHGINPLVFLRELKNNGLIESINVNTDNLPMIERLDPKKAYIHWNILYATNLDKAGIEDLLIFVIDDNPIEIHEVSYDTFKAKIPIMDTDEPLKLGEILVQTGMVREIDLQSSLSKQKKIGEILVDEGKIRPEQLSTALNLQETLRIDNQLQYLKIDIHKIDIILNLVEEMVIAQARVFQLGNDIYNNMLDMNRYLKNLLKDQAVDQGNGYKKGEISDLFQKSLIEMDRISRDIQKEIMTIRMTPIGPTLNQFRRMARDVNALGEKKIDLVIMGEDTELDKTVIEKIGNPLKHLVRNAIDHGIETIEQRKAAGKPEEGKILINAYHKEGHIYIEINDDGKGLDLDNILKKAIEKGLVSTEDELSEEQMNQLIFHPGLSTASKVTNTSGRGVGMDVVRTDISKLKGEIYIHTEKGKGSVFTIRLPLTLAIIDGMLISIAENTYIIPVLSIVETFAPNLTDIKTIEERGEVIMFRGEYLPVIRMRKVLKIPESEKRDKTIIVVVEADNKKYGLLVDELMTKQQIVIKSLEANYRNIDGITGATILGDGNVALILDISGIIKMFAAATA